MKKVNTKGFTIIEIILSFALVMFIAIGLFAVVTNYKKKQELESINNTMKTYVTNLTEDIYKDITNNKLVRMEDCSSSTVQCVGLTFQNGEFKEVKVEKMTKQIQDGEGSIEVDTFQITYGTTSKKVKYENPEPKFATVRAGSIFSSSTNFGYSIGKIFKIEIKIKHEDIKEDYKIKIVTTGIN